MNKLWKLNQRKDILEPMRQKIRARGIRGIMAVRRKFFLLDENDSKTIDYKEFSNLFQNSRLNIQEKEIESIFKKFDKDESGEIDYNEFITTLIGNMKPNRLNIIKRVFDKLDTEGKGYVTLNQIRYGFNHKECPKVRSGMIGANEALGDFIDLLEYHFNLLRENNNLEYDKNGEVIVKPEEFIDFFRNISMIYDEDEEFELAIAAEWGLDLKGKYPYQRGWNGLPE